MNPSHKEGSSLPPCYGLYATSQPVIGHRSSRTSTHRRRRQRRGFGKGNRLRDFGEALFGGVLDYGRRCVVEMRFVLDRALAPLVAELVFAVALEEITDGLDADLDRAGGAILIQILERIVRRARVLDDLFDHTVDGRVVTALEVGNLERHQVGMTRGVLGGPHLARRVLAVRILPYVADVHRARDVTRAHFVAKEAIEDVLVDGQRILREDGIAELLELDQ